MFEKNILKKDLDSPAIFIKKFQEEIEFTQGILKNEFNINLNLEETANLLLSACRVNDLNICEEKSNELFLNKDNLCNWISAKLGPTIVSAKIDDEDIIKLLLFSIEITYQMFSGGTKATITAKGFRERRRTFETILTDQFTGKLGEVLLKKFLESKFGVKIELDWSISRDLIEHSSDILNATNRISIKTTPTLAGIWAEADKGYDYGIMVKCSVPQPTVLQFFIEVCGFSRLLDFAESKISNKDDIFSNYLSSMRDRIKSYKCGEIKTELKGFICGYFKSSRRYLRQKGTKLEYLGEVREERYLVKLSELKWQENDWRLFIQENHL